MSHLNRYWWSLLFCGIFVIGAFVFLILHRFGTWPYFIWFGAVSWIVSVLFIFKALFFDYDYTRNNWIEAWEFSYRYFEGFGYSFASGGIVALFASSAPTDRVISSTIGIMLVGFFLLCVAGYKRGKIAKFKDVVSQGEKK